MIGIYAHHHGSGHILRCREIQRALNDDTPSTILSTHPNADIQLDDDAGAPASAALSAGGTLHYAPIGHGGYSARMRQIARWVEENDPDVFYVDVSVEVAAFVRLLGVPVVALAMPGTRDDAPHQLGYAQASAIIAAWPDWVELPAHLADHAERVHAVGGISRLASASESAAGDSDPASHGGAGGAVSREVRDPRAVTVMAGTGGSTWSREMWDEVVRACPNWDFTILDDDNRVDDPTDLLRSSGVVVVAAGQNSVADVAACNAPAMVLPQSRPFGEQEATAAVLRDANLAIVPETFPDPSQWPAMLHQAAGMETRWEQWQTEGAARRAADVILGVAAAAGQLGAEGEKQ